MSPKANCSLADIADISDNDWRPHRAHQEVSPNHSCKVAFKVYYFFYDCDRSDNYGCRFYCEDSIAALAFIAIHDGATNCGWSMICGWCLSGCCKFAREVSHWIVHGNQLRDTKYWFFIFAIACWPRRFLLCHFFSLANQSATRFGRRWLFSDDIISFGRINYGVVIYGRNISQLFRQLVSRGMLLVSLANWAHFSMREEGKFDMAILEYINRPA